ncbi:MAG TPA: hypothetical protein PKJ19_03765 [Flavobacteriales bacterium]|nr:hypothetical protein [Flavobacteriales bacterium]HNU57630.1 hypothetical protein [Flavobacteriales bacterium]
MSHASTLLHRPWARAAVVLLMAFAVLALQYGSVLQAPNSTLFNGSGDGLKNYYAFAYHVAHDSTYMQFEGMNHPFGEQIGYPDAQPALANVVKALSKLFPGSREHGVGIINLATLFSLVLTAFSLYLLLRHFQVGWFYAAVCAIVLTGLSPQTPRIAAGHHALSYGWLLTLPAYFAIRCLSAARPLRWALVGGGITFIGFYLHPYTGMIAASWMGSFLLLMARNHIRKKEWTRLIGTGAMVVVPILLFLTIQALTDHHEGRTIRPLGFFEYKTDWSGVLSPPAVYRSALSWWAFPMNMPQEFEATAYLGIATLVGIIVLLIAAGIGWARHWTTPAGATAWPYPLTALVLASLPLLAFAFGLPFNENHGPFPWSFPLIGQFRSPGRFAWPAYYSLGLTALFGAYWLRQRAAGYWRCAAIVFSVALPLAYLHEARAMHVAVTAGISHNRNVLSAEGLTAQERALINSVDATRYRAIIPVPNFLAGSDELLLLPDDRTMQLAMILSYWKGLPMTAYSLARTSVTETKEQLGLLNGPWYDRPIAERYAPDDVFLLINTVPPANEEESRYLALATPVAAFEDVRLSKISAAELFKDRRSELFAELDRIAGDSITDGWITTRPGERIFHTSFDDRPTEHVYAGTGAYSGLKRDVNTLLTVPANSLTEGERYVASYWTYTRGHLRNHALTCVAQRDPHSGREDWITCGDMRFARIVNGDWSLVELPFTANKDEDEYRIFVEGRRNYRDSIWCDEVMVRPAYTHSFKVLERTDGRITKVLFNGQVLTRPR